MKLTRRLDSFDGTQIAYRLWGEDTGATPIVFCSGIGCDDVYWEPLAPELSRGRTVITWDYPWHGDSGPPGDPEQITIPALARHAHCIVQEAGLEKAAFTGHSMGVQVIFEYYRLHPQEVSHLIAIAGPYQHTVGALYGTQIGVGLLAFLSAMARAQPGVMALLWRMAMDHRVADPVGRVGGLIGHTPTQVMERYFRHISSVDVAGLMDMFRHGQRHSAEDLLKEVEVPTLIIHGTADVMTPFYLAEKMARLIPDSRLVKIEGGAHTLPAEEPERIIATLQNFLRDGLDTS